MTEPTAHQHAEARWWRWLPAVPVLVGLAVFATMATRDDRDETDVEHISSDAPVFGSLGELVSGSDVIVMADVVGIAPGRSLGAADVAAAALVTELVEIDVFETMLGPDVDRVTIEQVAALGDGTPVMLDGQPASRVGERLLLFLVAGDGTDAAPYATLVNGQGRYELAGNPLEVAGPTSVMPVDWTLDELRRLVAACTRQPTAC